MTAATVDPPGAITIRPQFGPQELALSTPADVGIVGGSLFGGKTWILVVEPLRHRDVKDFTCVVFRRQMPEHTQPGGTWNESEKWYPAMGGTPRSHVHEWDFDPSALVKFAGLEYDKDLDHWKSAQICLLEFDQLETFTERMFWGMLSRNRSTCGVRPYCRASCNPDPDSFLATFLAWWIDDEGWAIPDRSGVIRWFIRVHDAIVWASETCPVTDYPCYAEHEAIAKAELEQLHPGQGDDALSVTFVLARLQDNAIGNALDPDYIKKVRALPRVEQTRLLGGDRGGNWKVRATAGEIFDRAWFTTTLQAVPTDLTALVRYWDKAGTQGGGKYSAGVLMGKRASGRYVILDIERGQWSAGNRETVIKQKAEADTAQFPGKVTTWVEQEPGSGGKESAENTVLNLAGHTVHVERVTGDKVTRAGPLSSQAEAGNIELLDPLGPAVKGTPAREAFLNEAQNFDGAHGFSDQIDAASGAFNKLALTQPPKPMQVATLIGFG
jgi:predicted phage terminase large subunit-like protein